MLRVVAAIIVAGHGLIHVIGFVVPWGVAQVEGFPYRTTVLGGTIALDETAMRAIGIVWLACAVGFIVAGLGIWRRSPWAVPLVAVLAVASIVLCVLGLPEAVAGIVVNAAILGIVAWASIGRPTLIARHVEGPGASRGTGTAGTAGAADSGPAR